MLTLLWWTGKRLVSQICSIDIPCFRPFFKTNFPVEEMRIWPGTGFIGIVMKMFLSQNSSQIYSLFGIKVTAPSLILPKEKQNRLRETAQQTVGLGFFF